ncbi:unnamed protein product [Dracunculus medinensis]|uniref:GDP-Man:Man(3)GlcNAc(2)-PP-Dol alpha-1,2-mannosyltransferase n=1 Tax=Dracunculus medinensis TaxID=318479 RepID=A0A0N4U1R3_DRAME|nr:unnamed protein product [Dracunculus medinensis]
MIGFNPVKSVFSWQKNRRKSIAFCASKLFFRCSRRRSENTIAFFHPYCNACGGGERVLWCAISSMQNEFKSKNFRYVIYTGDRDAKPVDFLQKANDRFNVFVDERNLEFIFLKSRAFLEAKYYPVFTLACQALGGLFVGIEAMIKIVPEVFIDTMGCPLTLPLFRWIAGSKVACYVHYPTISSDMISLVESRKPSYNNAQWITRNPFFCFAKLYYYKLFAILYKFCGLSSHIVMVNGSWTMKHINYLWNVPERTFLLYPPCDVNFLLKLKSNSEFLLVNEGKVQILSIGQIRPEKNHGLQLDFLAILKKKLLENNISAKVHLVICGGCRNDDDITRCTQLKNYASNLGLTDSDLKWALNVSFNELISLMKNSLIGLHTMYNEHFGISVVESVASGLITIAHDSGGPKLDILSPIESGQSLGFLASTVEEYVDCALRIIKMTVGERELIRKRAKLSVDRFSDQNFSLNWNRVISIFFTN